MKPSLTLIVLMVCALVSSSCARFPIDTAMAAIEANDMTAFVDGPGGVTLPGFTYFKQVEGDNADSVKIVLHIPPAQCKEAQCVFFRFFDPRNPANDYADGVPKGTTRVEIAWSKLLKENSFSTLHSAFWPFKVEIHDDRNPVGTVIEGEIRLRVLKKGYVSLQNSANDPNFAWNWSEGNTVFKLTTRGRGYVGRN